MINAVLLQKYAEQYGITLDETMCRKFDRYAELLVEWNQKMNLTAITAPDEIVLKHFVDSLTAAAALPKTKGFSLIDVGTGAGFPGVPLAILRTDIRLTLLDSLNKRLTFLKEVCDALDIDAQLIHARAEEGGRNKNLRETFDVATARAVAALPTLSEYCLPFVKVGGRFIAMKGPGGDAELEAAKNALSMLGGRVSAAETLFLPAVAHGNEEVLERRLITVEKIKPTPPRFPRQSAKIAKEPLG